ncbi:MAG: PAS domain S-box protein [Thermoplasmatales archaeon]|nr:MAG: PAS domain S-box protein [Thermoplasmatales archaeon]
MEKENRSISSNRKDTLVLGLNKVGEIIQFDKECQKITGYTRDKVLNRKIWDFLIPEFYIKQWRELFDAAIKNEGIDGFKIPLKTCDGKEVLISWSTIPLENEKGLKKNICFIGKNLEIHNLKKIEPKKNGESAKRINNKNKYKMTFKTGDERTIFEKKTSTESDKIFNTKKNIDISKVKKSTEKMKEIIIDLSKKYEKLNKKLIDLENPDRKLDRKNEVLDENLEDLNLYIEKSNEFNKESEYEKTPFQKIKDNDSSKKGLDFLVNPFGIKKKRDKSYFRRYALVEHQKELDLLEAQLLKDKKNLDKRLAELSNWKEKLLNLESEIEKRRTDLIEQEAAFRENLISFTDNKLNSDFNPLSTKDSPTTEENIVKDDHHDIFDKIPECAVIVQRGILKQVNHPFVELLGYDINEVIGKSLFDFFTPDSCLEIEKYYLDRLKGVSSSGYKAVFLTKDNNKLAVEVSTRPTIFNGEKAEIAVFNKGASTKKGSAAAEIEDWVEDKAVDNKMEDTKEDVVTTNDVEDKPE